MTYLFISDLHLSPKHPRLTRGFLDLLQHYAAKDTQLYILGDWFDAWIGDDNPAAWLDEIVAALQRFSQQGNQVFFQVGNRDFTLGQIFLNQFKGVLLPEIATVKVAQYNIRLEHGDALCTDDVAYQRFKKIIRQPLLLKLLLKLPFKFRIQLAQGFRKKSQKSQQQKSFNIMDVNPLAVAQASESVDILIHGHTHRPNIHHEHGKIRIVLGDWREQSSEAKILEMSTRGDWRVITWKIP